MRDFFLQKDSKEEFTHIAVVFEYVATDLLKIIRPRSGVRPVLSEQDIRNFMGQLLSGLLYLKQREVLHRDL